MRIGVYLKIKDSIAEYERNSVFKFSGGLNLKFLDEMRKVRSATFFKYVSVRTVMTITGEDPRRNTKFSFYSNARSGECAFSHNGKAFLFRKSE